MIRIDDVSKIYRTRKGDDVHALDHVCLEIEQKQLVVFVGQSGCGKSTLLKLVGGLIAPTEGTVYLWDAPVTSPREDVGIIFQAPVLLNWRTVLDNVLLPIELLKKRVSRYRDAALELIRIAGLEGFEGKHPRELSGGMQQRVAICRALIHDPTVLLMDEPFGALDALTREEMSFELLRIWEERRKTILFVTHSISEAVLLADRVVVMSPRPGRVAGVFDIDIPRPRSLEAEDTDKFRRYMNEIRRLIFSKEGHCSDG